VILAGKRIVKLNFGRRNDPVLPILRPVLRESREVAQRGLHYAGAAATFIAVYRVCPFR
jgi:hypothetical protein